MFKLPLFGPKGNCFCVVCWHVCRQYPNVSNVKNLYCLNLYALKKSEQCQMIMRYFYLHHAQVINVYSEKLLPFPLKVQLLDVEGNLSKAKDVKVHIAKDTKVKMSGAPFVKTDKDGVADFGRFSLTGDKGSYVLQPKASLGN